MIHGREPVNRAELKSYVRVAVGYVCIPVANGYFWQATHTWDSWRTHQSGGMAMVPPARGEKQASDRGHLVRCPRFPRFVVHVCVSGSVRERDKCVGSGGKPRLVA